ncbi:hypothetical protein [uncultured Jannaschia sp.]|uniref:hypothetical protein n=1 Tax=Jannaschia halovivens TaxID=3388667 RepID=UPI002612BE42|nr:hypothetical protein [uncultured Jannaschia sp.]
MALRPVHILAAILTLTAHAALSQESPTTEALQQFNESADSVNDGTVIAPEIDSDGTGPGAACVDDDDAANCVPVTGAAD